MAKILCCKTADRLTNKEKNEITDKVFSEVMDNENPKDTGYEITKYVMNKGYVFQEECEDE